jgi:hypothetical protein
MPRFRKGDRVTVTSPTAGHAAFAGRTGTVEHPADDACELNAVRGIRGRVSEAVIGREGFTDDELSPAG